jgi:hypothetical protein
VLAASVLRQKFVNLCEVPGLPGRLDMGRPTGTSDDGWMEPAADLRRVASR